MYDGSDLGPGENASDVANDFICFHDASDIIKAASSTKVFHFNQTEQSQSMTPFFFLSISLITSQGAFLRKLIDLNDEENQNSAVLRMAVSCHQNASANAFPIHDREDVEVESVVESIASDRTASTLVAYYFASGVANHSVHCIFISHIFLIHTLHCCSYQEKQFADK